MKVDLYCPDWAGSKYDTVLYSSDVTLKEAIHEIKSEESSFSFTYDDNKSDEENFDLLVSKLTSLESDGVQLFEVEASE